MNEIQRNVLAVIIGIQRQHGQEFVNSSQIAERLGLDAQTVKDYLVLMAEQGYITRTAVLGGCIVSPIAKGRIALQEWENTQQQKSAFQVTVEVQPDNHTSTRIMSERELLVKLRQMLATRFDEGELRTLSFDLGVDYDSLSGTGKADKARGLVDYLKRRNDTPDLVEAIDKQRSDIASDNAFQEIKRALSELQDKTPEQRQRMFIEPKQTTKEAREESKGLSLLEELIGELPTIKELDFYHPDFQRWHNTVKLSLRQLFGEDSYPAKQYDCIAWHTSDNPEDANQQRDLYSRSCKDAEYLLKAVIEMQKRIA